MTKDLTQLDDLMKKIQLPWRTFLEEIEKGVTITIGQKNFVGGEDEASLLLEAILHIGGEERGRSLERVDFDVNSAGDLIEKYQEVAVQTIDYLFTTFTLIHMTSHFPRLTAAQ